MREVENKTINPMELLDVFCEENCQNKWVCDANAQKCPTYLLLRKWIERMENKNGKIDVKEEDEDLEEQGLLVKLLCKAGDEFYCIRKAQIVEKQVSEISINEEGFGVYDLNGEWYHIDEIFFSRAEAETQLKEIKEKNNESSND